MTTLAQTAIDFCRECLGCDAKVSTMFNDTLMVLRDGERQAMKYTDLNTVMDAVRQWIKQNDLRGYLSVTQRSYCFGVHHRTRSGEISDADRIARACDENPCHALLASCVEASRKLKAA